MSQKLMLLGRSKPRFSFALGRKYATAHNELTIIFMIRDLDISNLIFFLSLIGYFMSF